ncbi:MAG: DEAD/DEAH box helicase [Bacteroidota bacterium]
MKFSELSQNLQFALTRTEVKEFTENQEIALKKMKSGFDLVVFSQDKKDEILVSAIHLVTKLKDESEDDVPRALILINGIDEAFEVEEKIKQLKYGTDLRVVVVHDKANKIKERNDLFDGCDIVIGNPKRVIELYFQNGINLKLLKHIILFNAHEIIYQNHFNKVNRLFESIGKCQRILFAKENTEKIEEFIDENLTNPVVLEL